MARATAAIFWPSTRMSPCAKSPTARSIEMMVPPFSRMRRVFGFALVKRWSVASEPTACAFASPGITAAPAARPMPPFRSARRDVADLEFALMSPSHCVRLFQRIARIRCNRLQPSPVRQPVHGCAAMSADREGRSRISVPIAKSFTYLRAVARRFFVPSIP
jgi:hypothetical protein